MTSRNSAAVSCSRSLRIPTKSTFSTVIDRSRKLHIQLLTDRPYLCRTKLRLHSRAAATARKARQLPPLSFLGWRRLSAHGRRIANSSWGPKVAMKGPRHPLAFSLRRQTGDKGKAQAKGSQACIVRSLLDCPEDRWPAVLRARESSNEFRPR